jgi:ribosome biogenesis GTPase A
MIIQWYPGHMSKALRMMEKEMNLVDLAIYVLDSRAPFSCVNPSFKSMTAGKPVIYVLNKSDLADPKKTVEWAKFFEKENTKSIILNSTLSNSSKKVVESIKELLSKKLEKNRKKGIIMPLRALVIGVPNSGKSTLVNNLCNKGKTVTGNKPGVTKGKQWVKIANNIELLDTPGTLWPSFEDERIALHLAYIGSIKDQVLDLEEVALKLIEDLKNKDASILENRYNISINDLTPIEIYEEICKKRGFILKGAEYDYKRAATAILDDFRKGRMGQITLDTFEHIEENKKIIKAYKKQKLEKQMLKQKERKQRVENYKRRKK